MIEWIHRCALGKGLKFLQLLFFRGSSCRLLPMGQDTSGITLHFVAEFFKFWSWTEGWDNVDCWYALLCPEGLIKCFCSSLETMQISFHKLLAAYLCLAGGNSQSLIHLLAMLLIYILCLADKLLGWREVSRISNSI